MKKKKLRNEEKKSPSGIEQQHSSVLDEEEGEELLVEIINVCGCLHSFITSWNALKKESNWKMFEIGEIDETKC